MSASPLPPDLLEKRTLFLLLGSFLFLYAGRRSLPCICRLKDRAESMDFTNICTASLVGFYATTINKIVAYSRLQLEAR